MFGCASYSDSRATSHYSPPQDASATCYKECPRCRRQESSHSSSLCTTTTTSPPPLQVLVTSTTTMGDPCRAPPIQSSSSPTNHCTSDFRMQLNNYLQANGGARLLSWEVFQTGPLHQPMWTAIAYSKFLLKTHLLLSANFVFSWRRRIWESLRDLPVCGEGRSRTANTRCPHLRPPSSGLRVTQRPAIIPLTILLHSSPLSYLATAIAFRIAFTLFFPSYEQCPGHLRFL